MDRDTQFMGFACKLLQELLDQGAYVAISPWVTGGDSFKSEQLIAQRAYDLAQHVVGHSLEYLHECGHEMSGGMGSRIMQSIPDMKKQPG